ncbi:hypothetical protein EHQ47_17140 [Leptospira bourretii]|uniref:hypothetical protein n=1 Tax=Leptospira bourretii TaxID=2484962 RepID=UPI0010916BC0|nr:hypothetical protein [Leptospira bourretii]TGL18598.1 hypothetical protein EHQ47_17140 [Leptospira bourretii]
MKICKLCKKEKELINKSHILPEFLYKNIYDNKHRYLEINYKKDGYHKSSYKQKGNYESDIFCKECDGGIISKEEKYIKENFYENIRKNITQLSKISPNGLTSEIIIDLQRLKRFWLFNLYRMSLSNLHFYKYINLRNKEESLRKNLYENHVFKRNEYPVFIAICLPQKKDGPEKLIFMPKIIRSRENGYQCVFYINGILHIIQISGHNPDDNFLNKWDYENSKFNFSYFPESEFYLYANVMSGLKIY